MILKKKPYKTFNNIEKFVLNNVSICTMTSIDVSCLTKKKI